MADARKTLWAIQNIEMVPYADKTFGLPHATVTLRQVIRVPLTGMLAGEMTLRFTSIDEVGKFLNGGFLEIDIPDPVQHVPFPFVEMEDKTDV